MFLKIKITSEEIALWIRGHFKKIIVVVSFCGLIGIAFVGWNEWRKKEEKKVQDTLYELQEALNKLVENKEEKALDFLADKEEKKDLVLTKEMKEKASSYEKAVQQNHKSKIAVAFAIDLADFYYRYGEREKAKELLSLFAFPKKVSSLYHLASFQLAAYYMDEKECKNALVLLSDLSLNKKAATFHLESDLQQALCLESMNRYEQALHKYEKILNKDPGGYTGRLAQDYKKLLILNKNLKKEK